MWKVAAIYLFITFILVHWEWSARPYSPCALAFEMDDSNETLAEQVEELTADIDVHHEIKKRIHKGFENPFSESEIDLSDYDEGYRFKMTTTHLPLEPTADEYRHEALKKLNSFRSQHSAPPLTINAWLNRQAETYAQHILAQQVFIPQVSGTNLSVDMYTKKYPHGTPPPSNKEPIVLDAIECWYRERYDYDYDHPSSHYDKTLNFTNIIWKSTQKFGLGLASDDEQLIIVALFYPPGNDTKQLRENVSPPETKEEKDGKQSELFKKMLEHSNLYF